MQAGRLAGGMLVGEENGRNVAEIPMAKVNWGLAVGYALRYGMVTMDCCRLEVCELLRARSCEGGPSRGCVHYL